MEKIDFLAEPQSIEPFTKVVFDRHGTIIEGLLQSEVNLASGHLKLLPENYLEIIADLQDSQCTQYNANVEYLHQYWQWSFHYQEGNVSAYVVEISDAVRKQNLFAQRQSVIDALRQRELTLTFRRLVHDLRSPVSALIGGMNILVPALSLDASSDEKSLFDALSKECNNLYDTLGDKLNVQLLEQPNTRMNKSSVDINALFLSSEEHSQQLGEYFNVNFTFTPIVKAPYFYCDLEKLSVAIFKMLFFLGQEYGNSTIDVTAKCIDSRLQFSFSIHQRLIKRQHQEFVENYFKASFDVGSLPKRELFEICQLISLNEGEVRIDSQSRIGKSCSWLFSFELN